MIFEITAYAARNALGQHGIESLLTECDWRFLTRRISNDKETASDPLHFNNQDQERIKAAIEGFEKQWFEIIVTSYSELVYTVTAKADRKMAHRIEEIRARNSQRQ